MSFQGKLAIPVAIAKSKSHSWLKIAFHRSQSPASHCAKLKVSTPNIFAINAPDLTFLPQNQREATAQLIAPEQKISELKHAQAKSRLSYEENRQAELAKTLNYIIKQTKSEPTQS